MSQLNSFAKPTLQQDVVIPACPLCDRREAKVLASFPEFTWVKCQCGLVFKRSSVPADNAAIGGEGSFGEAGYGQRYRARTRRRIGKSKTQIANAIEYVSAPAISGQPRLLDIGCSLGYTLAAAAALQLKPVGVDVSEIAVQGCRAQGFEAELAGLEALPFPDNLFAVVTLKHVLEHTATPRASLREVRRVLHPGGALFIAVPNAQYRKAERNPQTSRFYRPDSHGGIEHWIYYTPRTLSELLTSEGFRVRRVHPLLWRSRASAMTRIANLAAIPFRAAFATALTALHLRKEFWLVATPSHTT